MGLVVYKYGDILITIDEVHDLMQQADNLHEAEAKVLKEAKKKNNYEEYDEFNAKEQLQQLIKFTADNAVGRAEAQMHMQKMRQLKLQKGKDLLRKRRLKQKTVQTEKKS